MKKTISRHKTILAGKRRTIEANKSLGRSLAFVAGAINAGGFLIVNQYTSHMTGITSIAVDSIALNEWDVAIKMFFYIACFIFGSATSSMLVIWAMSNHLHSSYALPITVEATLLILFGIVNSLHKYNGHIAALYIIALLCYLMGLQNAVITKISSTTIRTTHVTGMVTDIGIEIGRILYSLKNNSRKYITPDKARITLHISIFTMFLFGGVYGAYGFKYAGSVTVIPLAGYLLFIAFHPIKLDLQIERYLSKKGGR